MTIIQSWHGIASHPVAEKIGYRVSHFVANGVMAMPDGAEGGDLVVGMFRVVNTSIAFQGAGWTVQSQAFGGYVLTKVINNGEPGLGITAGSPGSALTGYMVAFRNCIYDDSGVFANTSTFSKLPITPSHTFPDRGGFSMALGTRTAIDSFPGFPGGWTEDAGGSAGHRYRAGSTPRGSGSTSAQAWGGNASSGDNSLWAHIHAV